MGKLFTAKVWRLTIENNGSTILNPSLTTLHGFPSKTTTPAVFGLKILMEMRNRKKMIPMIRVYMGECLDSKNRICYTKLRFVVYTFSLRLARARSPVVLRDKKPLVDCGL